MLKAQNKENEQQQQQITKKMNASEVKEYKEDEAEDRYSRGQGKLQIWISFLHHQ